VKDKALSAIQEYGMLARGDLVVAGVSGGADSMALLLLLLEIGGSMDLEIKVCHVNHMLRGREADEDEAFVKSFCDRQGIDVCVLRKDIKAEAEKLGISLELCGRQIRYGFFHSLAGDKGKVATAHTLSDSVETVLFRMIRGTGIKGLLGIPPVRGHIIRPLIRCSRDEIEHYLQERKIPWREDSTNQALEYSRNRIRHTVIPPMQAIHGGFVGHMRSMMEQLAQVDGFLEEQARLLWERAARPDGGLELAALQGAHPALLSRVVRDWLEYCGQLPRQEMIEAICESIRQGQGKINVGNHLFFEISGSACLFHQLGTADGNTAFCQPVEPGAAYSPYSGKSLLLTESEVKTGQSSKNVHRSLLINRIDCDKINRVLTLRSRRPGDQIRLLGRGVTKSLKSLFQEAGIPASGRDKVCVLCDGESIVWVEGFGVSETAACDEATKRYWTVHVEG